MASEMRELLASGHLGALFKLTLEKHLENADADDLSRFVDVYRSHKPTLTLFTDAEAALAEVARFGPMGLITDGTHWVQKNKVEALGIEDRFAHVIYTNALGGREFHKPHPRAFELMEEALELEPAQLVYVGDNAAKDFVQPNARGWHSVQILRPDRIHAGAKPHEDGEAQHVLTSLTELAALVTELDR